MFAHISQYITLAVIIGAVSAELGAVLQAFRYMQRHRNKLMLSTTWNKILVLRWYWASPLFHESYRKSIGKDPAYRVSRALYVFAVTLATLELSYLLGHQEIGQRDAIDVAVVVATSYFAATYGKAFYRQRASVMALVKANA